MRPGDEEQRSNEGAGERSQYPVRQGFGGDEQGGRGPRQIDEGPPHPDGVREWLERAGERVEESTSDAMNDRSGPDEQANRYAEEASEMVELRSGSMEHSGVPM